MNGTSNSHESKRWWQRIVDRLSRRGATHKVGSDYRASTIIEPEYMPWYARIIEYVGRASDAMFEVLKRRKTWIIMGACAVTAALVAIVFYEVDQYRKTPDKNDHASVVGPHWSYATVVRARSLVTMRDWHDHAPPHGRTIECHREQCGTESCNPHPCVRVSMSSRGRVRTRVSTCYDTCPVYDDMCTFEYPVWPVAQEYVSHGDDYTPALPNGLPEIPWCVADNEDLRANDATVARCREASLDRRIEFRSSGHQYEYVVEGESKLDMRERFARFLPGSCWVGQFEPGSRFSPEYQCEKIAY